MGIPTSGPISLEEISSEFGGTPPHSLSEYYRNNERVTNTPYNDSIPTSGAISINEFYGTRGRLNVAITISANTANFDLYTACAGVYLPGSTDITVTINSGVTVYSTSYQKPAFTVASFLSTDTISIINNGTIIGAGGMGGRGADFRYGATPSIDAIAGTQGGTALSLSCATTVTNNGELTGGGGGGGGASGYYDGGFGDDYSRAGSGGGGGAGFVPGSGGQGGFASGQEFNIQGMAGNAGTLTTGGAGGTTNRDGGAGGNLGGSGVTGQSGAAGGIPGYYVSGIQYITWLATGTLKGSTV